MNQFWRQISAVFPNTANLSLWLLEKDGQLHIREGSGYFREHLERRESYRLHEGLTGWVFQGNEFVGTREDIEQHQETEYLTKHYVTPAGTGQADYYLILPVPSLFPDGHPIGVFKAEAWEKHRRPFTKEEREIALRLLQQNAELLWKLSTAYFAFISYVTEDSKYFVRNLAQDLRRNGILTWNADEYAFSTIRQALTKAINSATHVLLVISKGSKSSIWQQKEIAQADARRDKMATSPTVLVLRTDNADIKETNIVLSDMLQIDFINDKNYKTGLQRLLRSFGRSITSFRGNVPDPIEFFVGRAAKVDECVAALSTGKYRLVTVFGPAGAGKSTLVARVIHFLYEKSFDEENPPFESIIYLDLSTMTDEEQFASKLTEGFGCSEVKPGGSFDLFKEELFAKLPHSRQFLLILDGLEWLVERKECMDLFCGLMELAPEGPQILVTCRIMLKVVDNRVGPKEYAIRLGGLERGEALTLFKRCYGGRELDTQLEKSAVRVMERLDRLPLMIEVLAQFSRDEIIRFESEGTNPLNKDLHHLFYESYRHLKPEERRVFVSLSLFGDSFSAAAVQEISSFKHTKEILKTLESWQLIEESGLGRYRLLDLLREFSKSLLEDSTALADLSVTKRQIEDSHIRYYLSFIEQKSRDYATLNEEYANISKVLALLRDSIADRSALEKLIKFCFVLAPYWERHGKWNDSRKYTSDCLKAAQWSEAPVVRARMLLIHCWSSADLGIDFTKTYEQFIEALAITGKIRLESPKDSEVLSLHAKLLQQLGRLIDNSVFELEATVPAHTRRYGVFTRPEQYFKESYQIYHELGDRKAMGGLLRNLGFRSMVRDNLLEAATYLTDSADIVYGLDDAKFGRCLHQMGNVMLKLYDFGSACDEGSILAIKERIKPFLTETVQLLPSALDWAICLFEKALEIGQESMEERAQSRTLLRLGAVLSEKAIRITNVSEKQLARRRADKCLERALHIAVNIGEEKAIEKIQEEIEVMNKEKKQKSTRAEQKKSARLTRATLSDAFDDTAIKAVFLDVRGTVLSADDDMEMIADLRCALGKCAEQGIHLVIASATSLKSTGMGFVIEPLLREFQARNIGMEYIMNCFAYVESGTVAYRFHPEDRITPLERYEILKFRSNELEIVEKTVREVCSLYGREDVKTKPKPGQVNCYAGGPWVERRKIADHLNVRFHSHFGEHNRLVAQVPSARETIDVALCTKRRIAIDYIKRVGLKDSEVLIIGDSLQAGGNDEPLSETLPCAISVQVGEISPGNAVLHAERRGPQGVLDTINCLLKARV